MYGKSCAGCQWRENRRMREADTKYGAVHIFVSVQAMILLQGFCCLRKGRDKKRKLCFQKRRQDCNRGLCAFMRGLIDGKCSCVRAYRHGFK